MELTPLYELRERLRAGAIAGAALAADDFRLSRALEGLAPLEKASPVFARIGELTRNVLAPDCPDRAGALLDAITLCDSVLCTQGAVAVSGELSPLPAGKKGRAYTNAPYSVVAPLITALTTKGSGHIGLVQDTLATRSGIFQDYRIQKALVKALGASYGELADTVQKYLIGQDESLLPQLMESFDPAGKKEMVRRVQVIENIAKEKANDWYLEQLPQAKKTVRGALIYALRHTPENGALLAELAGKEKGDNRENALWALGRIEAPEALPFWRERLEKKDMAESVKYFEASYSGAAGALTAELFQKELDEDPSDPDKPSLEEKEKRLNLLFTALAGKTGEAVCDVYRKGAALGTALDGSRVWKDKNGNPVNEQMFFRRQRSGGRPFSVILVEVLQQSIRSTADPMLCDLARELYGKYKGLWAAPVLTAALLTKGTGEAAEAGRKLLDTGLIDKLTGKKRREQIMTIVCDGLLGMGDQLPAYARLSEPTTVSIGAFRGDPPYRPIAAPLDLFWYEMFMETGMEQMLRALVKPKDPVIGQKVAEYFYRKISMGSLGMSINTACMVMRDCGWQNWKGLLENYCKHSSKAVSFWEAISMLNYTNLTNPEKADQLHAVWVSGRFSGWPEKAVERQLEIWWGEK